MTTKTKIILSGGVAALALTGLAGVGIATADPTSSPTTSPNATASASPTPGATAKARAERKADRGQGQRGQRALLRRALQGEVTLAGPKHRVVQFQRGTVERVTATAITVRSRDGFVATYAVTADTKVRQQRQPAAIGTIAAQDRVRVVGVEDGKTVTAKRIVERAKR